MFSAFLLFLTGFLGKACFIREHKSASLLSFHEKERTKLRGLQVVLYLLHTVALFVSFLR